MGQVNGLTRHRSNDAKVDVSAREKWQTTANIFGILDDGTPTMISTTTNTTAMMMMMMKAVRGRATSEGRPRVLDTTLCIAHYKQRASRRDQVCL